MSPVAYFFFIGRFHSATVVGCFIAENVIDLLIVRRESMSSGVAYRVQYSGVTVIADFVEKIAS